MRLLPSALVFLSACAVLAACGGETVGSGGGSILGSTASSSGSGSSGARSTSSTEASGGTGTVTATGSLVASTSSMCVDIAVTPSELACEADTDCELVPTGEVCTGQCGCGGTAVNEAAVQTIEAELAPVHLAPCPCPAPPAPRCSHHQCVTCGYGPNQPPECEDAGVEPTADASPPTGGKDASTCVDIDIATYSTSCTQTSDCIVIGSGELCSHECYCPTTPVSASEQQRFDDATAGITFGACSCPAYPAPQCFRGQCVVCPDGSCGGDSGL